MDKSWKTQLIIELYIDTEYIILTYNDNYSGNYNLNGPSYIYYDGYKEWRTFINQYKQDNYYRIKRIVSFVDGYIEQWTEKFVY